MTLTNLCCSWPSPQSVAPGHIHKAVCLETRRQELVLHAHKKWRTAGLETSHFNPRMTLSWVALKLSTGTLPASSANKRMSFSIPVWFYIKATPGLKSAIPLHRVDNSRPDGPILLWIVAANNQRRPTVFGRATWPLDAPRGRFPKKLVEERSKPWYIHCREIIYPTKRESDHW